MDSAGKTLPCEDAVHLESSDGSYGKTLMASLLVILFCLWIATYWSALQPMFETWKTQNYHHGFFVPIVAAYLVWDNRKMWLATASLPSWSGIAVLCLCVWGWVVVRLADLQIGEQVLSILVLNAALFSLFGARTYKHMMFPMMFLLFMVPVGSSFIPLLMQATADICAALLNFFGIPTFREGMFMALPGGNFEVADVCSGLAHLISGLVLGTLIAYFFYRSTAKRILFVVSICATMIVLNGLRAFIVMSVASASEMRYLAGYDHVLFGYVLFVLTMLLLYWIATKTTDKAILQ